MIIQIDADGNVALQSKDDFKRFSVSSTSTQDARTALARLGRVDGPGHIWIAPEQIRELAAPVAAEWEAAFAAMVAYATGKGWTDGSGALRAHIEQG